MALPILFCHGLESAPIGRKSQGLIDLGYEVIAPDCRGKDLGQRIEIIVAALRVATPTPVVVGSSFGGIAGLVACIVAAREGVNIPGLVLCAPALQREPPPGTTVDLAPPCETVVVHGTRDDIIPVDVVRSWALEHDVPMIEVDDVHSLPDAGFEAIVSQVVRVAGATR